MTTERKKRIAEFRFGVIADLVGWRKLSWGERSQLLRQKSVQEWQIPFSSRHSISQATIAKWVKRYEDSGRRLSRTERLREGLTLGVRGGIVP